MTKEQLTNQLRKSFIARRGDTFLLPAQAFRLFNGFYEGLPGLVIDRYADTLLISNHSRQPESLKTAVDQIVHLSTTEFPEIESILLKSRRSEETDERKGIFLRGKNLPQEISEHGIRYAINLRLNQDDSFYLDTRNLREWLLQNSHGKSVLNCFAYTGTLGIAALAGGASALTQTDLNGEALALAERSRALNNFSQDMRLLTRDFFSAIKALKSSEKLFDTVILDSPFFSRTRFGKVDLQQQNTQLINKVRPLVAHQGTLIVINNALYVSGQQIIDEINDLSKTGYIFLDSIIKIPQDLTGYPGTILAEPPVDPAPFNHPTKICILKVIRKDKKPANV